MIRNRILTILATLTAAFLLGCAEDSPSSVQTGHTGQYKITHYIRYANSTNVVDVDTTMYLDVSNGVFTKYTQSGTTIKATKLYGILDIWVSGNDMNLEYKEDSDGLAGEIYKGIKTTFTIPLTTIE